MTIGNPPKKDEEEAIIEFNRQREKTFSQKMKESDHLLVIERERAKERQIRKPESVPAILPEQRAESRDIVSEKVGMKPRTFDKARAFYGWTA